MSLSFAVNTDTKNVLFWSLTKGRAAALAGVLVVAGFGYGVWSGYETWAAPPSLTVDDVQGAVGKHIRLQAKGNASDVRWVSKSPDLELAPHNDLKDPKTMHVVSAKAGSYTVWAIPVHHGLLGEALPVNVTVGDPGPGPGPVPPPSPAPIPVDGFRALIVYDTTSLGKLPKEQETILYAKAIRDYLNAKCVVGADGKTKEWRIWPSTVNAAAESKLWQDALARPRASVPWILISTGKAGYEGPLPATVDATMTILQKFGG